MKYTLMTVALLGLVACKTPNATSSTPTTPAPSTPVQTSTPTVTLESGAGAEIGSVYEAYLSPHQEPGEEENTPAMIPKEFRSTAPSLRRSERTSRGHGTLRFSKDLSKVYVDVKVENIKAEDIVMFHIHCGKPDQLGPIVVDFALAGNIQQNFADSVFSVVVTNDNITQTAASGHGLVGAFTAGCPIIPGTMDKVKTVAGMELIARHSELYFNLHTKGQVYFGDIRGQLHPVSSK